MNYKLEDLELFVPHLLMYKLYYSISKGKWCKKKYGNESLRFIFLNCDIVTIFRISQWFIICINAIRCTLQMRNVERLEHLIHNPVPKCMWSEWKIFKLWIIHIDNEWKKFWTGKGNVYQIIVGHYVKVKNWIHCCFYSWGSGSREPIE